MTPSPQVTEIPLPAYDNNSGILTVVGGHYRAYLGGTWFRISSKTYTPKGLPIQRKKKTRDVYLWFCRSLSPTLGAFCCANIPIIFHPLTPSQGGAHLRRAGWWYRKGSDHQPHAGDLSLLPLFGC